MRLDVRRQRALDGERPEALATLVGLLVRVDTDVTHEVARLLEFLRAVRALVPAYTVHLQQNYKCIRFLRWLLKPKIKLRNPETRNFGVGD